MATLQEISARFAEAKQSFEDVQHAQDLAQVELNEAYQRQGLRTEIDQFEQRLAYSQLAGARWKSHRNRIDQDLQDGSYMKPPTGNVTSYEWKVRGMSELPVELSILSRDYIYVGSERFYLAYSAGTGPCGSLTIRHHYTNGISFKYKLFIKRAGGDFTQWGKTGYVSRCTMFGPDVPNGVAEWGVNNEVQSGSTELEQRHGIFGLSHEELLKSEWVEHDTMTVRVQLEVCPATMDKLKKGLRSMSALMKLLGPEKKPSELQQLIKGWVAVAG